MKNITITAFFLMSLMLGINHANSQEFKITRTDVEKSRSGFVTATYLFGIDISVDSLKRSNGVTFELHYTKADSILLSDARLIGFGPKATSIVIPFIDTIAQTGVIYVGVLSGDTVGVAGYDDPKVIHFEFVVSQSCRNQSELTFTFANAQAIVNTDSGGKIVDIKSAPLTYQVHGFIDVWPGDADGNGVVEIKDVTKIGLYLGFGSFLKQMRSFKRQSSSTNWVSQSVLGWDSLDVTWADCDGNGDITVTDMLIIALNFNKTHGQAKKDNSSQLSDLEYKVSKSSTSVSIPVFVNSNNNFIGATAKLDLSNFPKDSKFLGFEKGNIFNGQAFSYCNLIDGSNYAEIVVGSKSQQKQPKGTTLLGYAVIELGKERQINSVRLCEATGMSSDGFLFPMNNVTSVIENDKLNEPQIVIKNNYVYLENSGCNEAELKIFNINGNEVFNLNHTSFIGETQLFPVSQFQCGIYYCLVSCNNQTSTIQFSIIH